MKRIVLTGGPGAGKTVISCRLAADHPDRFVCVPEAATQVYAQLQTRWDKLSLAGRFDAQRRIYHLQIAQEQRLAQDYPNHILLLDRGTIDGAAYWPDGPDEYWRDLGTNLDQELTRYDAVIWMETAAALGHHFYDGDNSNTCRFEDAGAAIESGKLLSRLWHRHPKLTHLPAYPSINDKIAAVHAQVTGLFSKQGSQNS